MKKLYMICGILLLSGCLNTQNRKISMHTDNSGVSSVNSEVKIVVNPKSQDEQDLEYFQKNSLRWPEQMKKPQKEAEDMWQDNDKYLEESF